jgi:hypothetical protein
VGTIRERTLVRDGNRFTGGGVTVWIDFALTLMAEIAGPDIARAGQLALEYDPHPPFNSGSPRAANPVPRASAPSRLSFRGFGTIEPHERAITGPTPEIVRKRAKCCLRSGLASINALTLRSMRAMS